MIRIPVQQRFLIDESIRQHFNRSGFIAENRLKNSVWYAGKAADLNTLFLSLCAVVMIAALFVQAELARLFTEEKTDENRLLVFSGFSRKKIFLIFLFQFGAVVFIAAAMGSVSGIFFTRGLLLLLDLLRPQKIAAGYNLHVSLTLLIAAFLITGFTSLCAGLPVLIKKRDKKISSRKLFNPLHAALLSLAPAIVLLSMRKPVPALFGGMFLSVSLLAFVGAFIIFMRRKQFSFNTLPWSGILYDYRPALNLALPSAFGLLLLYSVFAHRTLGQRYPESRQSGTGGFGFFISVEDSIPHDLNKPEVQKKFGLTHFSPGDSFVQCRLVQIDDASCLNLNKSFSPSLLGVPVQMLAEKKTFSFIDDRSGKGWNTLTEKFSDGSIPCAMDESPLLWSLAKKKGDTLIYTNEQGEPLKLHISLVLKDSVFQGHILLENKFIQEHFPSTAKNRIILAEGDISRKSDLLRGLDRYGPEILSAGEKLAEYEDLSNAYLGVFFSLAGIAFFTALAGSTILMLDSAARHARFRALMAAIGFSEKKIFASVFTEYCAALILGIISGITGALISTCFISGMDLSALINILTISFIPFSALLFIAVKLKGRIKSPLQILKGNE